MARSAWMLLVLTALGCGSTHGEIITTSWTTHTARPSDELADSVGIDVRLSRMDSAYYSAFDELVVPALERLGVRHVRDELGSAYRDPELGPLLGARVAKLRELHIRLMVLTNPRLDIEPDEVDDITSWAAGAVEAFEAPTDYDSGRQGSSEDIEDYTRRLSERVRQLGARPAISVVAPGCESDSCTSLPELVDFGNASLEVSTDHPGQALPAAIAEAQRLSSSRPIVSTGIAYRSGPRDQERPGVSDVVMAKYVTRALLVAFENDVFRSYVRHLLDSGDGGDVDANSALVSADGREKAGFIALRNLLQLVADPGITRFSGALTLRLTGDLSSVHRILLKTRAGRFFLILWQEVPSWDAGRDREIAVPPRSVRLELRQAARVAGYTPVLSPNAEGDLSGTSFALDVPDHPLVVAIDPE
jgi:hypothetical protein